VKLMDIVKNIENVFNNLISGEKSSSAPGPTGNLSSTVQNAPLRYRFSSQIPTLANEAHKRPIPSFGTPTLVWHVGIWCNADDDPSKGLFEDKKVPNTSNVKTYKENCDSFQQRRKEFYDEINKFFIYLQCNGRGLSKQLNEIDFLETHEPEFLKEEEEKRVKSGAANQAIIKTLQRESVSFTIWWHDRVTNSSGQEKPNLRPGQAPQDDALRIRVQAESHIDHLTISFFIDAGKPWDNKPVYGGSALAPGVRRHKIFKATEEVKAICGARLKSGAVEIDKDLLPETADIDIPKAEKLLAASNLLYDTIWKEFIEDFGDGVKLLDITPNWKDETSTKGRVFANFRGLVIATPGIQADAGTVADDRVTRESEEGAATCGRKVFPKFQHIDKYSGSAEPNAVVKAYWPFIRRITPYADYREFVASGVFGWRAIYITGLGADHTFVEGAESRNRLSDVRSGNLPELTNSYNPDHVSPIRYLILCKCEPHRRQIGRIVDRINALGTMRLFALKDYVVIRQVSENIRLRGLELDAIMARWSAGHDAIQTAFLACQNSQQAPARPLAKAHYADFKKYMSLDDRESEKAKKYDDLTQQIEPQLIEISRALDNIGGGTHDGILYTINRANYYIEEFYNVMKRLDAGNIESWVSYDQFVDRGLKPVFDFIKLTGVRLSSLRGRLQTVTQIIQTTALFLQTSETRRNTNILKKLGIILSTFNVFAFFFAAFGLYETIVRVLNKVIGNESITEWLVLVLYAILLCLLMFEKARDAVLNRLEVPLFRSGATRYSRHHVD